MTTDEKVSKTVTIVERLIPYGERSKRMERAKNYSNYGEFYSYLINDWILSQPDKDDLMELFILLGFKALPFVELVIHQTLDRTLKEQG